MGKLIILLATVSSVLGGCASQTQMSCVARMENIRNTPGITEADRAANMEHQIQICRAEQGDKLAMKWLQEHNRSLLR